MQSIREARQPNYLFLLFFQGACGKPVFLTHLPLCPAICSARSVGELRRAGVTEAPTALFSLGQVVKVRVVSSDAAKRRIVVCEASSAHAESSSSSSSSSKKLDAAALAAVAASAASAVGADATAATLVGVEGSGADAVLSVRLADGTRAQLPAAHLTDHAALVAAALEAMRARVGRTLFDESGAAFCLLLYLWDFFFATRVSIASHSLLSRP